MLPPLEELDTERLQSMLRSQETLIRAQKENIKAMQLQLDTIACSQKDFIRVLQLQVEGLIRPRLLNEKERVESC